ncbi:zinc-ribbon domain-containing protein [Lancefieldella parvula]|uniref:zinc ribbon domain-containing protein n=1 Tax=Lancefieldella parvula TaxID=1382 RepID=UPI0028D27B41|nr:zinc-ribbon domain-containing protein [Lancefieldella parvula]
MNCPNCGAEIGKHAKFCSNCGQKLSDVVDTADVADVEKPDALAESTEPAPETAPDNSIAATEVIAPAEADDSVDTATDPVVTDPDAADPDATVLAEYPAGDDDAAAAETSLLEATADDSYISPDEAPTTVAAADPSAAEDPTVVADADPTVIADPNAADAEEPTTFINDPDRINVFTTDDLDSTAISHFDPSQFTVVSSGPSSVERKQTKDGSDALRKVAFGLLAAVLVVGALAVAWVFQSHQNDAAKRSAVQQRIASYQEQIESVNVNPSSDSSRVELLNQYEKLDQIEEQITGDQKNGQFRLPNGTDDSGVNILNSSISDGQKRIRDWFEADYKRRLAANSFNDTDSATTLDLKSVSNRLVELQALLGDIEHEKEIWGNDTGANSTYDSYHSRVSDQIKKGESLKSGVTEKNKKEQEQKDKDKKSEEDRKKAQKWVGTYSGTGTDGKPMEVVIQKDGTVIWRIGGQPEVRGTWTGDENKLELSFNGQVSGKSEPFTLSSTNGGRTVSISSESSTWNTDTLSRK